MIQPKKGQTAHTDKHCLVFPRISARRFPGYAGLSLVTVCVLLKIGVTRVCEAVLRLGG